MRTRGGRMIREWAQTRPEAVAVVADENGERTVLTYARLHARAQAVAAGLRAHARRDDRVLLMFQQGHAFIEAFLGCWYAGVTPVPVAPPDPTRLDRTLPRVLSVAADAEPVAVLSTAAIRDLAPMILPSGTALATAPWIAVDELPDAPSGAAAAQDGALALLQYTSGSTGDPKGVLVTHESLDANITMFSRDFAIDASSVFVSWLPQFHDMGLIGATLGPLAAGGKLVVLSPIDFLKRPRVWLELLTEHRGTHAGAPNFGFDLCVRKVPQEAFAGLDLSAWTCAWNGAEPIRWSTLSRFAEHFAPVGFSSRALLPCYGLAEATLFVTGHPHRDGPLPAPLEASLAGIGRGEVVPPAGAADRVELVACGAPQPGTIVAIVDSDGRALPERRIGEVWNAGAHVASGYRGRTSAVFGAVLAEYPGARFMRTGDLGALVDGQLVVTGRVKDLLIIRGRNLFPSDIEDVVNDASPFVRPGCSAAISVQRDGVESVVVVVEVERRHRERRSAAAPPPPEASQRRGERRSEELPLERAPAPFDAAVCEEAIRTAVATTFGVSPTVCLIVAGTIPKTTSGKVQRLEVRRLYETGGLTLAN